MSLTVYLLTLQLLNGLYQRFSLLVISFASMFEWFGLRTMIVITYRRQVLVTYMRTVINKSSISFYTKKYKMEYLPISICFCHFFIKIKLRKELQSVWKLIEIFKRFFCNINGLIYTMRWKYEKCFRKIL